MSEIIKFSEQNEIKEEDLIPVHINTVRCENYYWHWSSDLKDWIRGQEIPEQLKKLYKIPLPKGIYKK